MQPSAQFGSEGKGESEKDYDVSYLMDGVYKYPPGNFVPVARMRRTLAAMLHRSKGKSPNQSTYVQN